MSDRDPSAPVAKTTAVVTRRGVTRRTKASDSGVETKTPPAVGGTSLESPTASINSAASAPVASDESAPRPAAVAAASPSAAPRVGATRIAEGSSVSLPGRNPTETPIPARVSPSLAVSPTDSATSGSADMKLTPSSSASAGGATRYDAQIEGQLAAELSIPIGSVRSVVEMQAEGATVPFIARYRKEKTGGLDEVQIRTIFERRAYLLELETRRASILSEIKKQGKLTEDLSRRILAADTKAELEDLYLPYKPKRRTKAMIAKERGLEPLADLIWDQPPSGTVESEAAKYVSDEKDVTDTKAALSGARDIIAERLGENAALRRAAREIYMNEGVLKVTKNRDYVDKKTKFDNYAEFSEPVKNIASHRYLAVRRGETEGVLTGLLTIDEEAFELKVRRETKLNEASPFSDQLKKACHEAMTRHLLMSAQMDVRVELKMRADKEAVSVFATNLRELLMAAPFGARSVIGIDPGQRTGCKVVVLDHTGKLLENDTMYLVQGEAQTMRAEDMLLGMCKRHQIAAIAVGNGTHGRETESFVKKLLKDPRFPQREPKPFCVSVSESGASVYSASDVAREEFPDLDLTVRGAISIARRLQDPLAELVKIDPKSIGVGQYQHDVFQTFLSKKLDEVVESCVHEVGVELNTASAPLLSRVSGLGPSVAKRIVDHRNQRGSFSSRAQLLDVSGLGPRAFEQAAGFLRIRGADHPLDASAVHPERYELVERIAADLGVPVHQLIGSRELLARIDKSKYLSENVGAFTMDDIFAELLKPGRDPRDTFEPPNFREDVTSVADLKIGMSLEGVVTNVAAFGAFVDIGVHQDGLVHLSKLADRFIKDPSEVVKVGDKIQVRVLEVDLERQRISLTARKDETIENRGAAASPDGRGFAKKRPGGSSRSGRHDGTNGPKNQGGPARGPGGEKLTHNPFADLFRR